MTTTTEYGTWANYDGSRLTVEDTVADYLGDQADGFDVEGLVGAYADAINEALPAGIALRGHNFYGPHPRYDGASEEISAAIESVDLGELAQRFDRS